MHHDALADSFFLVWLDPNCESVFAHFCYAAVKKKEKKKAANEVTKPHHTQSHGVVVERRRGSDAEISANPSLL